MRFGLFTLIIWYYIISYIFGEYYTTLRKFDSAWSISVRIDHTLCIKDLKESKDIIWQCYFKVTATLISKMSSININRYMITDDTYTHTDLIRHYGCIVNIILYQVLSYDDKLCNSEETFSVIKCLIEQKHLYCTCLHLSCYRFYYFLTMKFQPKFLK